MNETNTSLLDYYLLPTSEIGRTRVKRFRMTTQMFANSRLETPDQVVKALRRSKVAKNYNQAKPRCFSQAMPTETIAHPRRPKTKGGRARR